MELTVKGRRVYGSTGGRDFDPARDPVIFLHGSGMDRTVWQLQTRYFAWHGRSVLAVDLPGHGKSEGPALASIEDVIEGRVEVGRRAVLLAAENHHRSPNAADVMSAAGAEVHLVTMGEMVASDIIVTSRPPVISRMKRNGVVFHREHWIKEVSERTAVLSEVETGRETVIEDVDTIVGGEFNAPNDSLYEALIADGRIPTVTAVGDCVSARKLIEAMREGHVAARSL